MTAPSKPLQAEVSSKPPASPELGRLLTREMAEAKGLVPKGHVWDEARQEALPLGMAIREESIARGEDLEERLKRYAKDRAMVLRFIAEQMHESEYFKEDCPQGKKGYPVPGRMGDYYRLPGFSKKVLTKQGSEKLMSFFNLRRARTQSVALECTKEFCRAVIRVELVDRWGMPAGSGEAACSSAETGIQRAKAKYNGDFRAAENDVASRAGKRATTQAVVYATATDEIFDASGELERKALSEGAADDEEPQPKLRRCFPDKIKAAEFKHLAGQPIDSAKDAELAAVVRACREAANADAVRPLLEACLEEQEKRRLQGEPEEEPI